MQPENNTWKSQRSSSNSLPISQKNLVSRFLEIYKTSLQWVTETPQLRVWQTWDEDENVYWNGYDPITRRSIHRVSESQIRVWIEQRHH